MEKKTAFVSGAAGGLGKATVRELLKANYKVIATDLDVSALMDLMGNPDLDIHSLDVTDPGAIKSLSANLRLDEQGLDLFAGLAGIYDTFPLTDNDPGKFNRIIQVNFMGNSNLISILARPLIKKHGRVVVVSSESYKIQAVFQPYMVSKAALEIYCRAAWQELALKGVWLSVIRPGAINTPLLDWMHQESAEHDTVYQDELVKSLAQSKKMVGKISTPEQVADVILKAATDKRPKRFYLVNNNPMLSLVTMLPSRFLDRMIVRRFQK